MLRRSESTTAQARARSRSAMAKIVRSALPLPGTPTYGVTIRCTGGIGWDARIACGEPSSVAATTSGVPSREPPSEFTITAGRPGKCLARPRATARTTWPIVRALL